MDDEDEQINTKGLSLWLHPNLPRRVSALSVSEVRQNKRERKSGDNDNMMGRVRGLNRG